MISKKMRFIIWGGILGALIVVFTAFVKVPTMSGYFHVGDAMIALAGAVIGPFAAIPAAIGSCIGDVIAGYAIYAPFSFVIKGVLGIVAGLGFKSGNTGFRAALMMILGGCIIAGGYFAADSILYSTQTAFVGLLWNVLQAFVFIMSGAVCMGSGLKNFMDKA